MKKIFWELSIVFILTANGLNELLEKVYCKIKFSNAYRMARNTEKCTVNQILQRISNSMKYMGRKASHRPANLQRRPTLGEKRKPTIPKIEKKSRVLKVITCEMRKSSYHFNQREEEALRKGQAMNWAKLKR